MNDMLMGGIGRHMLPIPRWLWRKQISGFAKRAGAELGFMSEEHRAVHHCVVRELPKLGAPLLPEFIAGQLSLPLGRVTAILDEMEKHLILLFRDHAGSVTWAYPVTVEATSHHVTFSTGEQLYAA